MLETFFTFFSMFCGVNFPSNLEDPESFISYLKPRRFAEDGCMDLSERSGFSHCTYRRVYIVLRYVSVMNTFLVVTISIETPKIITILVIPLKQFFYRGNQGEEQSCT